MSDQVAQIWLLANQSDHSPTMAVLVYAPTLAEAVTMATLVHPGFEVARAVRMQPADRFGVMAAFEASEWLTLIGPNLP